MSLTKRPYREIRLADLSGGVNDSFNETLLKPNETPNALNVEFNRRTVQTAQGSIKFNNQTAPRSSVRTRVDPSFSPLYIADGLGVPLRGYVYMPYSPDTDIGGGFQEDT